MYRRRKAQEDKRKTSLSSDHDVDGDAQGPPVHLLAVPFVSIALLGSCIARKNMKIRNK